MASASRVIGSSRYSRSLPRLNVEQMAQRLYSVGRSRQHFIEKYGSRLGAMLWQMRQSRFVSHFLGKYEGAKPAEKAEDAMSAA